MDTPQTCPIQFRGEIAMPSASGARTVAARKGAHVIEPAPGLD